MRPFGKLMYNPIQGWWISDVDREQDWSPDQPVYLHPQTGAEEYDEMVKKLAERGPQYVIAPEHTPIIALDGTVIQEAGRATVTKLYEDEPMHPLLLHFSSGPENVVVATINDATIVVLGRNGVHARTTITEIFRCVDAAHPTKP